MAANFDLDDQSAGGSMEIAGMASSEINEGPGPVQDCGGTTPGISKPSSGNRQSNHRNSAGAHSGDTSPGGSNSLSNESNRTRTSEASMPTPFFFPTDFHDCSSPDQDDDSDDDDDDLIYLSSRPSVAVQTDYNEDFPPLKFLRSMGDDGSALLPPVVPVSTTPSSDSATSSSSADGTLQLVIQNFRHMSDTVRGPSKYVQSVPWRIMVMPRQHVVQKKGTQKCLGFFLQCCPDAYSESWSCQASAELRLISQKTGVPNFTRKTNHVYTAKENDWGYSCFMTWADILDESQGYIKDDKVVLEVQVKADPPKNILTHKEFQKKIQDYKRLADLQCQRGLIDKAIECNTQALKFCKDKDPECKADLEAQKAQLIEMKLKQSIQRIEKGNDPTKLEDDSAANLNALRHALGSTAARATAAKTQTQKSKTAKETNGGGNETAGNKTPVQTNRAGTPPYIQNQPKSENELKALEELKEVNAKNLEIFREHRANNLSSKQPMFTKSKTAEPNGNNKSTKSSSTTTTSSASVTTTGTTTSDPALQSHKKVLKSASSSLLCGAGSKCKGHLNNKALVALGHFNKALLNSDEFEYVARAGDHKYQAEEEEELLPDQIQHYLQHLSEKDKESSRLKRFSAVLEQVALPFESSEKNDAFLNELFKLAPKENDLLAFAALERELSGRKLTNNNHGESHGIKRLRKKIIQDGGLCDKCLKEEDLICGGSEKRETSEFGCQTEFSRRLNREVLTTDNASMRMMQQPNSVVQQPTAEEWALNTVNALAKANNVPVPEPPPTLPVRRKKATAKKTFQQQQQTQQQNQQQQVGGQQNQQLGGPQQHNMFQQFPPWPKASPRNQQQMSALDLANAAAAMGTGPDADYKAGMDILNASIASSGLDKKPSFMNMLNAAAAGSFTPGSMELAAFTADLDLSKFAGAEGAANAALAAAQQQQQAQNIFSRQYIEEWLRYSARNVLKLNYDSNGKAYIAPRLGGASGDAEQQQMVGNAEGMPIVTEPEFNEAATALGVIGLNCVNARNIQQKVVDFVDALESHANFRDLRPSIERLVQLLADDPDNPAAGGGGTEDTVSVVSVSECSTREMDISKEYNDFANFPRLIDEDPHDYMLLRELKQAEMLLNSRLNSILYQLHHQSVSDIVDRVEGRIKSLEESNRLTKANYEATKGNEAQIAKQYIETQKSLQTLNDKYEKVLLQLKDRKNEIKKLEKKAKSEAQLAAENVELHDKLDALKKELGQVQRQLSEEQAKYKRDTQSLADSKKHLSAELNTKYAEVQKLTNQLEEKGQALKKSEAQLANERKGNSSTISSLTERAKKAEVGLLEHKLEDGLRVLERARDDCGLQIKQLEEQLQKRHFSATEQDIINKNIAEWDSKKEEVVVLINQAKTDFGAHISAVKSGKTLSQLPKIQVPKPPPCPKLHPMPMPPPIAQPIVGAPIQTRTPPPIHHQQQQQCSQQNASVGVVPSPLPLDRKAVTPPNSRASGRMGIGGGATTPQQQMLQQPPPHIIGGMGPQTCGTSTLMSPNFGTVAPNSLPGSMNVTPVKSQLMMSHHPNVMATNVSPQPLQQQQHNVPPPLTPIGVRPHNYQNGVLPHNKQPSGGAPGTAASIFGTAAAMHLHHQQQQQLRQSPTANQGPLANLSSQLNSLIQQQQQQMPPPSSLQQQQQAPYLQQTSQHMPQQNNQQPGTQSQQQNQNAATANGGATGTGGFTPWGGWGEQSKLDDIVRAFRGL